MSIELSAGILGLSHYHAQDWTAAIAQHPNARLVGVWDRDTSLAAAFALRAGCAVFTSRDDLLAEADVVTIASTTSDHVEDAVVAAAAGRHILLEKPPSVDLLGLAAIRRSVEASGVLFAQNFPKRLDRVSVAVRDEIRSGRLGPITTVRIRHGHSQGWDDAFRHSWFADPSRAGAGALLDEGIHTLDFSRWLLGEPEWIWAQTSRTLGLAVEDTALISLGYAEGPVVSITTSWSMAGAANSVEVHGRDGSLDLGGVDMASRGLGDGASLRRVRRLDAREWSERSWETVVDESSFGAGGFHGLGVTDLLDAIVERREPSAGLDDAEAALRLVTAAYESAQTGRTIWLS